LRYLSAQSLYADYLADAAEVSMSTLYIILFSCYVMQLTLAPANNTDFISELLKLKF